MCDDHSTDRSQGPSVLSHSLCTNKRQVEQAKPLRPVEQATTHKPSQAKSSKHHLHTRVPTYASTKYKYKLHNLQQLPLTATSCRYTTCNGDVCIKLFWQRWTSSQGPSQLRCVSNCSDKGVRSNSNDGLATRISLSVFEAGNYGRKIANSTCVRECRL